eukprot:SAG11_NODE_1598_length_4610_cov_2.897362_7_plen_69_part_00
MSSGVIGTSSSAADTMIHRHDSQLQWTTTESACSDSFQFVREYTKFSGPILKLLVPSEHHGKKKYLGS